MPTKGIVYYTCLTHRDDIEQMCRAQLAQAADGLELITVSRGAFIPFGENYVIDAPRSPLTMHRQVVMGLEHARADIVFLCESDVLYHPSHFDFTPEGDGFCYNTNVWRLRYPDGLAVWSDGLQQVSGVCADRERLLDFYTQRVAQMEREGFNRHYEPGIKQSVGSRKVTNHQSAYPNLCIRHDANLTASKWSPAEFRNPQYAQGWKEAYAVEGWGDTRELFKVTT